MSPLAEMKKLKRILVYFTVTAILYTIIIAITIPHRWYYQDTWFTGLNGWEFGILLFGLFLIISKIYLVPGEENAFFREEPSKSPFRRKSGLILHVFFILIIFLFLFATQIIQTLVSRWSQLESGDPSTSGLIRVIYDWCGGVTDE